MLAWHLHHGDRRGTALRLARSWFGDPSSVDLAGLGIEPTRPVKTPLKKKMPGSVRVAPVRFRRGRDDTYRLHGPAVVLRRALRMALPVAVLRRGRPVPVTLTASQVLEDLGYGLAYAEIARDPDPEATTPTTSTTTTRAEEEALRGWAMGMEATKRFLGRPETVRSERHLA